MGAFRGAGRPEAAAMLERLMDLAAAEMGMDPLDIRRRNLLPAAGTDFFTTTFCRQIRVWISISWLAKVGRRFHGITISPEISRAKALARFPGSGAAQEAAREKIGLNWKETGCRPLSRVCARCRLASRKGTPRHGKDILWPRTLEDRNPRSANRV